MARRMRMHKPVLMTAIAGASAAALLLSGCSTGGGTGGDGDDPIYVTIITKDTDNHFWTAMIEGAETAAENNGVELTVASGKDQTDADGQIRGIEDAIARGDDAILIANNGPAVDDAIRKAREAGLLVIALDTPTDPLSLVDATMASDNFNAGELIGQWTAATLGGEKATIALLDLFGDKIVSIDHQRGQGFVTGMGIDPVDDQLNGDEAPTGSYSGGDYEIVCNEATNGAEDGARAGMENCLSLNPDINVVYTSNEPGGVGADAALRAAGVTDAIIVSIDGSCSGIQSVADGQFGAVAQQYPSKMGQLGIEAVIKWVADGSIPQPDAGLEFIDTGITLVTDNPVDGLDSITSAEAAEICW